MVEAGRRCDAAGGGPRRLGRAGPRKVRAGSCNRPAFYPAGSPFPGTGGRLVNYRDPTIGMWLLSLFLAVRPLRAEEAPFAAQAVEQLKTGNARFASDKLAAKDIGTDRRQDLAKGQTPFAVILTCAGSRVAPERVFDQGLGDLFVLRVAGNVAAPAVLGSIEYAVEHLHTPLIVVMGHESCGAVKAAIDGGHLEGNLGTLIRQVHPGRDLPKDPKAGLDVGVKNNVLVQTRLLTVESAGLKEVAQSKRVGGGPAV